MLLDEVVFEIECFAFIFCREEVDFRGFLEHFLFSKRVVRKILSESFLKIFGFADIENDVLSVFEQIDSCIAGIFADVGSEHT